MKRPLRFLLTSAILMMPATARGQGPSAPPPPPAPPSPTASSPAPSQTQTTVVQVQTEERSTGLPTQITWKFNFDAGWGNFGFANSLFQNPKDDVPENLSDQWFEGYAKPAISGTLTKGKGEFFGKLSAVGERTYGSAPSVAGADISSFGIDDASIGWRSGTSIDKLGENGAEFIFGRAPFQLGKGFLLYDGASEGGSRGGYWTNARKAFELAVIGRVQPGRHKGEFFYLDRDELPESDSGSRLWGGNYEFGVNDDSSIGVTYLRVMADPLIKPGRDGLNIFDFRAFFSPIPKAPDLSAEFEYANESNGDVLGSNAWYVLGAYELSKVKWTPKMSYRYAFFQGDDLTTPKNEAFDALFLGFNDWGAWWQGEIAGEYFLSNSNLISHQIRVHMAPAETVGMGFMFFKFNLDQPASFAPGVTSKDVAGEFDWYTDWKLNKNFTASFVAAFANPGKAAEEGFGRTKNFSYGMVYLAYSF